MKRKIEFSDAARAECLSGNVLSGQQANEAIEQ
jgi:hypothetical protein